MAIIIWTEHSQQKERHVKIVGKLDILKKCAEKKHPIYKQTTSDAKNKNKKKKQKIKQKKKKKR